MKTMRKIFALALAVMMVMSLAATAFAAEDGKYDITIPAGDAHNYEIYQIFTGDYAEEGGKKVLSNIVWGQNGTGYVADAEEQAAVDAAILDALKGASGNDAAKLDVIKQYVDLATAPYQTVTGNAENATVVAVEPGYYLLKDASLTSKDDAYTTFIVLVVDDVTVNRKAAKPGIDKQVWDEETDDDKEEDENWGETADHELNETFQFKLIATMTGDPDYTAYETYKLVFHDTMSKGVTYLSNETVTVVSNGATIPLTKDQYTLVYVTDETTGITTLTITIANIKGIQGVDLTKDTTVTVIYDAELNEDAVIGNIDDNLNDVYLEYSNNPNWEWSYDENGKPENPGDDGKDNDGDGEEDEEDEKDEPTGETEKDTVWVFTYEVKVNKIDGETEEKLADAEFQMKNAEGKWLVVDEAGKVQDWIVDQSKASVLKSNADGVFSVIGLDHGTYHLVETKAPAGYNLVKGEIEVKVEATHEELTKDTAQTVFTVNTMDEVTVKNFAGTTLPETGGMGTTAFHVMGGFLVLVAVVLLTVKRRMYMAA